MAEPKCCLPGHVAPPLTDQILSELQISPIWTQSHCHQSVSTSQQRPDCRCLLHGELSPSLTQLPHPSVVAIWGQQGALPQIPMPQKVLSKESHKDRPNTKLGRGT